MLSSIGKWCKSPSGGPFRDVAFGLQWLSPFVVENPVIVGSKVPSGSFGGSAGDIRQLSLRRIWGAERWWVGGRRRSAWEMACPTIGREVVDSSDVSIPFSWGAWYTHGIIHVLHNTRVSLYACWRMHPALDVRVMDAARRILSRRLSTYSQRRVYAARVYRMCPLEG